MNEILFAGTVRSNKMFFAGTVRSNKTLFPGTVSLNKTLFEGTVPTDETLIAGTEPAEETLIADYWIPCITNYVKNCLDYARFRSSNQKSAGLLQTPVPAQRFEIIAIDLFGPLPESKDKKKCIFIVEDVATRWVELFALPNATARECATVVMGKVFLRFGLPRRAISNNGTQFVSAVMQQLCYLLKIHQSFIPVYRPQANPVERKNRDLKSRLAILVEDLRNS
ncbi:hypothetical protein AVEN_207769-1 [Araneus ventricosus]|uniref:Integrase catalytic domain-containing protein n=1 Tax=Araneus ventricosus TaxID=182803 RepID=A0A4Y2BZ35_ARAVE|nr:hypothetical protein AVEN_207769-1 [Araneus ventricosus]